ncbi:MAG TPA: hypothetical protein VJ742_13095 [Nitrososphaera sp.]|nr:hypothetical protein [Nitrososphaera sp.]
MPDEENGELVQETVQAVQAAAAQAIVNPYGVNYTYIVLPQGPVSYNLRIGKIRVDRTLYEGEEVVNPEEFIEKVQTLSADVDQPTLHFEVLDEGSMAIFLMGYRDMTDSERKQIVEYEAQQVTRDVDSKRTQIRYYKKAYPDLFMEVANEEANPPEEQVTVTFTQTYTT